MKLKLVRINKGSKKFLLSDRVTKHLPAKCEWWSSYIYHFSHVTNIAAILNDGLLKCRNQVQEMNNQNLNDNASTEVIGGTNEEYKDYVRFYFRPLTPTQYHNEGIRTKNQITDLNAHCPVPVFLLFDTEMLDEPNVFFSYESLASHYDIQLYHSLDDLEKAPFNYIYHNSSTYGLDGVQIRKHRHAEVVTKDECNLKHLQKIVCRNEAEADTLRELLDPLIFDTYNDIICSFEKGNFVTNEISTMFQTNYLFITSVEQSRSEILINFNKKSSSKANLFIKWSNINGEGICEYSNPKFTLNKGNRVRMGDFLLKHEYVKVEVKFNADLIFCKTFKL